MGTTVKTVLVTGSLGLVGSEAMDFFAQKGWKTHGIDNNMRTTLFGVEPAKIQGETVDIRNEKEVDFVFSRNKFDAIIHTAGQPSHSWSEKEPLTDFDINARGTLILLEATRKYCPDAPFIFCSSDKIYGTNMDVKLSQGRTRYVHYGAFDESLSLDHAMRTPFGCSKTAADLYVQEYGYYFGIKTVCFRPGCITGRRHKGAKEHGFLANLTRCAREDETFPLYGFQGKQVRDNIHSYDLVNAMWHFIQKPKIAAVYNIGGGFERSCSPIEAIEMCEKILGRKMKVEYIDKEHKADRAWDIHDVSKFRKDYPEWEYKYSLKDIMKELCVL